MKRKIIYGIIGVSLITAVVSMFFIAKNQREQQMFEQARQEFEENVLTEYLNEMRSVGFEDLEITVKFIEYPWDEWTDQVEITEYHTEEIDSLYTEEYGSENAKELTNLLKTMRTIRDRYCKRYVYEIQGKEIAIIFNDDYTEFFTVHSEDHMYKVYTYEGKHSMSINGDLLYYTGGESSLPDKTAPVKKHQYTTPTSSNNKDNLYDDYDVYEYDDPEDFYYDWEDDFDGYEDAEEYWEDAWDEIE